MTPSEDYGPVMNRVVQDNHKPKIVMEQGHPLEDSDGVEQGQDLPVDVRRTRSGRAIKLP